MDDKLDVKVTGVYEDFPRNSEFARLNYISTWEFKKYKDPYMAHMDWGNNAFQLYVQIADHADMETVSRKIKDAKLRNVDPEDRRYHPQLFLHPMSKWHLYGEFKNGVNTGGAIQYVWLFGIIGGVRADPGLHQFHEPQYGPFTKKSAGSGHPQSRGFAAPATDRTILHGIHTRGFPGISVCTDC